MSSCCMHRTGKPPKTPKSFYHTEELGPGVFPAPRLEKRLVIAYDEQIFDKGQVKVKAILREVDLSSHRLKKVFLVEEGSKFGFLFWSVERL